MHIEGIYRVNLAEHEGQKVEYETAELLVDGRRVDPEKYKDCPHYSNEFQWGYGGTGPAFTAYVLLLLATGEHATADKHHQNFKWEVVAQWGFGQPFRVEFDIDGWIAKRERMVTE